MNGPFYSRNRLVSAALVLGISAIVFVPWKVTAQAQQTPPLTPQQKATQKKEEFKDWVIYYNAQGKPEKISKQARDNARQLGNACMMYLSDNNNVFKTKPSTFQKDIGPYLANNRMNKNAFMSPLDKPGTQSFQFNRALQNVSQKKLKNPENVVMAYEGAWGEPLFRYNGVALIVFAEGHAKPVTPAQAKALIWSLQAQTETPKNATKEPLAASYKAAYEAQKKRQKDANAALQSGDTKTATRLAQAMLQNNTDAKDWNYGNTIHNANQILGLAALKENRANDAKSFLLAAGKTPGSPQLDSFGPYMVLAQKLLEKGEKQTVMEYLDRVSKFWVTEPNAKADAEFARMVAQNPAVADDIKRMRDHQRQIALWKQQIASGQTPELNMSGEMP